ncbi:hypothetical protein G6F68_020261 [Rhizopus microsporus]|nr:hypothetical protein G6F68_020261 [Rhizopus microsporus]
MSPSRRQPSMVKALSFSGRFSTTVAMSPSRCSRMGVESGVEVALMGFLWSGAGASPRRGSLFRQAKAGGELAVLGPFVAHIGGEGRGGLRPAAQVHALVG